MEIDGVNISVENLGQDLLQLLVGERWPNGDVGAMRELASAWNEAADRLDAIRQDASAAAKGVDQYLQGSNAEAFQSFWSANFDDGETSWPAGTAPAALPFAVQYCKAMANALNSGATQIETTKDTIMGNIAILVATVAPQIAGGFLDFGITDATALAEILAEKTGMQFFLDTAGRLMVEVVLQAIEQGLAQAELNFIIQFKEVEEGHASGINWGEVGGSGLSGAAGGALGTVFGAGAGKLLGNTVGKVFGEDAGKAFGDTFGAKVATGVVAGGLTNATMDLAQNGKISASDFAKGSAAAFAGAAGDKFHGQGETPAIDTAHLPDPEAVALPGADDHTTLSGLAMPPVTDHGILGASSGNGDGLASAPSGSGGSGLSFDPSPMETESVASGSSIARILGGGSTQEAGIGASVSTGSASSGFSTGAVGLGVQEHAGGSGGGGNSAGTSIAADPLGAVGSGGFGSFGTTDAGGVSAGVSTPAGARAYGSADVDAAPISARADVGGAGSVGIGSAGPGSGGGAGASFGATSRADAGLAEHGDTSPASLQYPRTLSADPAGGGVSAAGDAGFVQGGGEGLTAPGGGNVASGAGEGVSIASGDGIAAAGGFVSDGAGATSRSIPGTRPDDPADGIGAGIAVGSGAERSPGRFYGGGRVDDLGADHASFGGHDEDLGAATKDPVNLGGRVADTVDPNAGRPAADKPVDGTGNDPAPVEAPVSSPAPRELGAPGTQDHPFDPADGSADREPAGDGAGRLPDTATPTDPTAFGHEPEPTPQTEPQTGPQNEPQTGPDTATDTAGVTDGADGYLSAESLPDDSATAAGTAPLKGSGADGSSPDTQASESAPPAEQIQPVHPDQYAPADATAPADGPRPTGPTRPDATASRPDPAAPNVDRGAPDRPAPDRPAPAAKSETPRDPSRQDPSAAADPVNIALVQQHNLGGARSAPDGDPGAGGTRSEAGTKDPSAPADWSPPQLSEHVAELKARADYRENGLSLFSDPVTADLSRRISDPNGAFVVDLHTDATGGISGLSRVTGRDIADLAIDAGVRPPQKILLTGCFAGALHDGLASEVSRRTGCDVVAGDTEVWSDEAGHVFASGGHIDGFGRPAPDIPPTGAWHEFHPDGTSTEVGDGGFPPGQESGFGNWQAPVGETRARGAEAAQWDAPRPKQIRKVPDDTDPALRPLEPGERFSERSGLPESARIDVVDANGTRRGTFFTDETGKITHAELRVPNTRHGKEQAPPNPTPDANYGLTDRNIVEGSNPDAATPPAGATVKYTWRQGNKSVVFKIDDEGEPLPPAVWKAADTPVAGTFQLEPKQSVFGIDPSRLEPNTHYKAEQTPYGKGADTGKQTTEFWTDSNRRIVAVDTWKGQGEEDKEIGWNPNLGAYKQAQGDGGMRFRPGVTFRVDGQVVVTDGFGRPTLSSRDAGAPIEGPLTASVRSPKLQIKGAKSGKDEYKESLWDGGHKLPAAVGGPSELINYYAQGRADNQGWVKDGADREGSWYTDERDTVAAIEHQGAVVTGWDIIESHDTGTPGNPDADPPEQPIFNNTPEVVIVRKTYRYRQADGTLGPPRTTIRFTINVKPDAGSPASAAGAAASSPGP